MLSKIGTQFKDTFTSAVEGTGDIVGSVRDTAKDTIMIQSKLLAKLQTKQ